jgi:hypothetical protein
VHHCGLPFGGRRTGLISMPSGTVIATAGAIGASSHDLAADSTASNYYIPGISVLKKVTSGGTVSTLATAGGTSQWISAAVDGSGNIIIADNEQHGIWRVSPNGLSVVFVNNYPTCTTNLEDVYVRIDSGGNYVIATDNCSATRLYRMTPAGVVTTVPLSTTINSFLGGLAIDSAGNYVTSGYSASSLFSTTPAGQVTTLVNNNAALSHNPFCVAYDPGAQFYIVCSTGNATLLSVTPAGVLSTLFTGSQLVGNVGVIVTTPGTFTPTPGVPTTPAPSSVLLMMTAMLAISGFLFWKRRTAVPSRQPRA